MSQPTVLFCTRPAKMPDYRQIDRWQAMSDGTVRYVATDGIIGKATYPVQELFQDLNSGVDVYCEDKNWEAPPVPTASQWFQRWEEAMSVAPLGSFCRAFLSIQVKDGTMRVEEKKLDDKLNAIVISIISPAGEIRYYSRIDGHWRRVDTPLTVREMLDKWEETILQENSNKRFKKSDFPEISCANGFVTANVWDSLPSVRLYGLNTKNTNEEHRDYSVYLDGWGKIAK